VLDKNFKTTPFLLLYKFKKFPYQNKNLRNYSQLVPHIIVISPGLYCFPFEELASLHAEI